MSEDRAKEIIAEKVAKEVVESIGEDLAGALVEYANLVKELAADLTDEQLEDSGYIKSLLGEQLPNWDWEDWYELLKNVRREKYKNEHEEKTAENIFNDMPYFAKEAAQSALKHILKAEKAGNLYRMDAVADTAADCLWNMFYCCIADIKRAATKYNKEDKQITVAESREHKDLFRFIEIMRETLWEQGEVFKIRERE